MNRAIQALYRFAVHVKELFRTRLACLEKCLGTYADLLGDVVSGVFTPVLGKNQNR
jgi:hypothetical protein